MQTIIEIFGIFCICLFFILGAAVLVALLFYEFNKMTNNMFTINIQNIGGIFYINGKRLGHDTLLPEELQALDEFIREYKQTKN